ncbi:MAG TPA: ceramidase domain-containing protein [Candidatus Tectomicrobia bacterium]
MCGQPLRSWVLGAVTVGGVVAAFWVPPIPQDPTYHAFADRRTFLGTPNFWNVWSNLAFVLVGAFGLSRLSRLRSSALRSAYVVFCSGVVCVGVGSASYHYAASTPALVWDRLPMTVIFMAFVSMVVHDRLSEPLGRVLLWPLVLAGVASVGYWHWAELQGRGDLRAYGVIQFLPVLLMPLMLMLYTGKVLSAPWLCGSLGTYALAKVAEHWDHVIYDTLGFVSGHSLKHVLGALAVLWAILAVRRFRC